MTNETSPRHSGNGINCVIINHIFLKLAKLNQDIAGVLFFKRIAAPFSSTSRATLEKFWLASVMETN
jgi:hypothetical protein